MTSISHWTPLTNPRAAIPRRRKFVNPWGISERQAEALETLAKVGYRKVVAYQMEISEQRLTQLVKAACDHMGVKTDIQAAIEWDRWARSQEAA